MKSGVDTTHTQRFLFECKEDSVEQFKVLEIIVDHIVELQTLSNDGAKSALRVGNGLTRGILTLVHMSVEHMPQNKPFL